MHLTPDSHSVARRLKMLTTVGMAALMPLIGLGEEQPTTGSDSPITIEAEASSDSPRLRDANDGTFFIRLRMENTGDEQVVLWPYLSPQLTDAEGEELPTSLNIGRWGLRRGTKDSILEEIEFVSLESGETHEVEVRLNRCVCDSRSITGWNLTEAGDYTLSLHYVFDRDEVKETFGAGCRVLNDAEQDWNRGLETDQTIEVAFRLR